MEWANNNNNNVFTVKPREYQISPGKGMEGLGAQISSTIIIDPEALNPKPLITPLPEPKPIDIIHTPDQSEWLAKLGQPEGFSLPSIDVPRAFITPIPEPVSWEDLILTKDLPGIDKINGQNPRNAEKYAGKIYELPDDLAQKYPDSVKFDEKGFPRFEPYTYVDENGKVYEIKSDDLIGDHSKDFDKANEIMGVKRAPEGYTWHHVEDGKTMIAVPTDLHNKVKHTGGAAKLKEKN